MKILETSFGVKRISLSIVSSNIYIDYIPKELLFKECLIFLTDVNGVKYDERVIECLSLNVYKIDQLDDGLYYLNWYNKSIKDNLYWGYLGKYDAPINIKNGILDFILSLTFSSNKNIYVRLLSNISFLQEKLKPSWNVQNDDYEIIKLAKEITKYRSCSYQKVFAIHNWVAENIYYDMDAFYSGEYAKLDSSALGTLTSRKSVCQGYSDLSIALLRASGIPAMGISCFALGLSTTGGWERPENRTAEANHQITLAYADNRWIIMDITWDSDNVFIHGKYQKKTGMGISHKYFDNTLAFISNSHRFIL